MPCRSDYLESTVREKESVLVATLLIFALSGLGQPVPKKYIETSENYYGNLDSLDADTAELCSLIQNMNNEDRERIVYDAHCVGSRRLATWWENHQEADRIRESNLAAEAKRKAHKALEDKFKALTLEEKDALLKKLATA